MSRNYETDPTDARFILVDGKRHEADAQGYHYVAMNEHGFPIAEFNSANEVVHADGRTASRIDPVEVAGRDVEWVVTTPGKDHTILASTFDLYRSGWQVV